MRSVKALVAAVAVVVAASSSGVPQVAAAAVEYAPTGGGSSVDLAAQAQAQLHAARAAWGASAAVEPADADADEEPVAAGVADLDAAEKSRTLAEQQAAATAAAAQAEKEAAAAEEEEARQDQQRAELEAKAAAQHKQREDARARAEAEEAAQEAEEAAKAEQEAEEAAKAEQEAEEAAQEAHEEAEQAAAHGLLLQAQEERAAARDAAEAAAAAQAVQEAAQAAAQQRQASETQQALEKDKAKKKQAAAEAAASSAAAEAAASSAAAEAAASSAAAAQAEAKRLADGAAQAAREQAATEKAAREKAARETKLEAAQASKLAAEQQAAKAERAAEAQAAEAAWAPGSHQVCAALSASSLPPPLLVWADAVFTVPRRLLRQSDVSLSAQPLALLSGPCALEAWAGTEVLHFFGFCGEPGDGGGRQAARPLGAGEAACPPAASDDECYVRASPFGAPCLELKAARGGHGYRPRPTAADAGLKFIGYRLSRFDGIGGAPFEEPWLWEGFLGSLPKRTRWLAPLNYRRPVYLAAGLAITFAAEPLVENRAFQYAVATAAGVTLFLSLALLLVYLCFSHLLKVSQQTAWGSFLHNTALFLPPLAAVFYRTLFNTAGTFLQMMLAFWARGTCFLDPMGDGSCTCALCAAWAGKVYFGAGALLGLVLESRCRFFKYPEWVYDDQGWAVAKCGQKHLGALLRAAGLGCFLLAFSSADAGLVLAFLMTKSAREQLSHWTLLARIASAARHHTPFKAQRQRLSQGEYEAQMQSTTERELMRLRGYVNQQHEVMARAGGNGGARAGSSSSSSSSSVLQRANFDEETTRRLEAFRVGGADARRPWERSTTTNLEEEDDEDDASGGGARGGVKRRLRRGAKQMAITAVVVGTCAALVKYLWTEV